MDWLPSWALPVALVLLRLALPAGLTLAAGYLLARLDARWQAAGEREARTARAAEARAPCWELRGCDPEARARCPAYQGAPQPCWQVFRRAGGRLPERCFGCPVFLAA
jgi:hypothetical protein